MANHLEYSMADLTSNMEPMLHELTLIPAPSGQEELRANYCVQYLRKSGAVDVSVDRAGNVLWRIPGRSKKWIVMCAHLDTVFDKDVPLSISRQGNKLYCPGIGDDTANVTVLLTAARWLSQQKQLSGDHGLLIAFNTQEETGCAGTRQLVDDLGPENIYLFYSFDGTYKSLYSDVVNIRRYSLTVHTPGGHALGAYGNPNAISVLAHIICMLQDQCESMIETKELKRTTFNVEFIEGGERAAIIARFAKAQVEFRSDKREHCEAMEEMLRKTLNAYESSDIQLHSEPFGPDPMWSIVPDNVMKPLEDKHLDMMRALDLCPKVSKSATDCRYPMSKGIPSLCFGLCEAGNPHTRDEWVDPSSMNKGLKLLIGLLKKYIE